MLIIRCCKCGAWIGEKDDSKDGIRETHSYCDSCYQETIEELASLKSKEKRDKDG